MKRFTSIMSVFLFFAGTLSTVKVLESYTDSYQNCANAWLEQTERLEARPHIKSDLVQRLAENDMFVGDEPCPALRAAHRKIIQAKIDAYY